MENDIIIIEVTRGVSCMGFKDCSGYRLSLYHHINQVTPVCVDFTPKKDKIKSE